MFRANRTNRTDGGTEKDKDNLFKVPCGPFTTPAEMLAAIAHVFNWGDQDWSGKEGRFVSDFAWACSGTSCASDSEAPTGPHRGATCQPRTTPWVRGTTTVQALKGRHTHGRPFKTAAGYGWFDSSESIHIAVTSLLTQRADRERKAGEERAIKDKAEAEAKAKDAENAERKADLAGLSPDEGADKEIELMTPSKFENTVRAFFKEPKRGGPTEEHEKAIVRALRGPRLVFWHYASVSGTTVKAAKGPRWQRHGGLPMRPQYRATAPRAVSLALYDAMKADPRLKAFP